MLTKNKRGNSRVVRHLRLRKRVIGSSERLRLSLYPSLMHLEAQFVDDLDQKTVLGLTTKSKDFLKNAKLKNGGNVKAAVSFGKFVADKAKEKGISKVVFDRGGFAFHGRIKAFADAAREQGLSF